jgi:RNA polymerase sigma-70 factor (ECF subfamily)
MAPSAADAGRWLPAARGGSSEALGQLLEACRGYLLLVAQRELATDLQAKGGASDLVQETLLDAVGAFRRFRGSSEAELLAWLRRLLLNNLVSFTRRYRAADKRQVGREVRLAGASSSGNGAAAVAADAPSPSHQALEHEQAEALRRALDRLPDDYRRVLLLRFQEDLSFEDIGQLLGVTSNAARKLWARAVKRLQQETGGPP